MHSALSKTADSEDLSLVQLDCNAININRIESLCTQNDLRLIIRCIVSTVEVVRYLTSNHQALEAALFHLLFEKGFDIMTVTHNSDTVADINQLRKVMGDEDYGATAISHRTHILIQNIASMFCKCIGCLVNNQQLRLRVHSPCDFNQFSIFQVQCACYSLRVDVLTANLRKNLFSFSIHRIVVDAAVLNKAPLFIKKDIRRNRD